MNRRYLHRRFTSVLMVRRFYKGLVWRLGVLFALLLLAFISGGWKGTRCLVMYWD